MRQGIAHFEGMTLDLDSIDIPRLMRQAGFIEIVSKEFRIPIGPWAKDPNLKLVGHMQSTAMLEGIKSLSLAIFTRALGWELNELEVLLAKVRRSLKQKNTLYLPW